MLVPLGSAASKPLADGLRSTGGRAVWLPFMSRMRFEFDSKIESIGWIIRLMCAAHSMKSVSALLFVHQLIGPSDGFAQPGLVAPQGFSDAR